MIISQIWASITGNILSPYKWVFDKAMPTPSYKVVFYYLRYWGMWFKWTMRNGFLFDEHNNFVGWKEVVNTCIITIYEVVKIARVVFSSCFDNKHWFTKKKESSIHSLGHSYSKPSNGMKWRCMKRKYNFKVWFLPEKRTNCDTIMSWFINHSKQ